MILRLLQFSDDHPRIDRVYANFLWRQLQSDTPGNLVQCSLGDIVRQHPTSEIMSFKKPPTLPMSNLHLHLDVLSYPGKERIPLTLDTLLKEPSCLSYCSRLVVLMVPISKTPALFTSTSSLPNFSTVWATILQRDENDKRKVKPEMRNKNQKNICFLG